MKCLEARPHEMGWIARMRMVRHDEGHGTAKKADCDQPESSDLKSARVDAAKLVRTDHEYKLGPV